MVVIDTRQQRDKRKEGRTTQRLCPKAEVCPTQRSPRVPTRFPPTGRGARYTKADLRGQPNVLDFTRVVEGEMYHHRKLGKHSDWDPVEQWGNPAASPLVRDTWPTRRRSSDEGGVSVKQARPRWWRAGCEDWSQTCGDAWPPFRQRQNNSRWSETWRFFCVAFHSMKRGFELSAAVAAHKYCRCPGERGSFSIFSLENLYGNPPRR